MAISWGVGGNILDKLSAMFACDGGSGEWPVRTGGYWDCGPNPVSRTVGNDGLQWYASKEIFSPFSANISFFF